MDESEHGKDMKRSRGKLEQWDIFWEWSGRFWWAGGYKLGWSSVSPIWGSIIDRNFQHWQTKNPWCDRFWQGLDPHNPFCSYQKDQHFGRQYSAWLNTVASYSSLRWACGPVGFIHWKMHLIIHPLDFNLNISDHQTAESAVSTIRSRCSGVPWEL